MKNYILLIIIFLALFMLFSKDQPSQSDIQSLVYAKKNSPDYIYPQISHGFQQLSKGNVAPLNTLTRLLPSNKDNIQINRTAGRNFPTKQRFYLPDYYRKDTMPQNDIGSEEMRPFVTDDETSEKSWTDQNVSEHPKYYTSDFKNSLTNPGNFFDKTNQYNDTTSDNTFSLPSDKCYTNKKGQQFCMDNTRLQNIPPALITNPNGNYSLDTIGDYKNLKPMDNSHEKVMNGATFYNDTNPSQPLGSNESPAPPLQPMIGTF